MWRSAPAKRHNRTFFKKVVDSLHQQGQLNKWWTLWFLLPLLVCFDGVHLKTTRQESGKLYINMVSFIIALFWSLPWFLVGISTCLPWGFPWTSMDFLRWHQAHGHDVHSSPGPSWVFCPDVGNEPWKLDLGGGFKCFWFSPRTWEKHPFWFNIFRMGWINQLEMKQFLLSNLSHHFCGYGRHVYIYRNMWYVWRMWSIMNQWMTTCVW